MASKPRSVRQAQALHSAQLHEEGYTWAEIGVVFQRTYRVNPRVAMRQAHGWSQPQAAERWTEIWPDDPKTFKNFSYWEQWPGQTGHAPSLETLDRLARLYECKITDLLGDFRDYGAKPKAGATAGHPIPAQGRDFREQQDSMPDDRRGDAALSAALETIRQAQVAQLIQAGGADEEPGGRLRRRTLLLEASSALAVVAAAPVLEVPRFLGGARPGRRGTDVAIVSYASEVVAGLRRLGGTVGPRITLQPAMALRAAMAALARSVPGIVTSQALTAYGDLTQLIGWLMFNLGDYKAAWYYYDDAKSAAHRAGNNDLVAYTLAAASQLADTRRRPEHAMDHAQAALAAARESASQYAVAYAADVAARAYAAAGQARRCRISLDREREALIQITDDTPRSPWWYFYDSSFYWGTESECALKLNMPACASDAARRALGLPAAVNCHNSALTLAFRAEALIKQNEITHACETLADSARLTTLNSSRRIAARIVALRRELDFAQDTVAVRELDEKLTEYRKARAASEAMAAADGEAD